MKPLTYAAIYNTCYELGQTRFMGMVKKNTSTRCTLRTRYHWSKHIHKMITTSNPQFRFTPHILPFAFLSDVSTCHRIANIARLQLLRRLQRALLRWIWRPHGPFFNRYLAWDVFTSTQGAAQQGDGRAA